MPGKKIQVSLPQACWMMWNKSFNLPVLQYVHLSVKWMISKVIALLCCLLFVMYWEMLDNHSWERKRKVTASTEENGEKWLEGEIQKTFRQLWAAEQVNTPLSYLTAAQHCTTYKSLAPSFTGAVILRKTWAPRVRQLQNSPSTCTGILQPLPLDAASFSPAGKAKGKREVLITKQQLKE